jgi:hypothetical protein
MAVAAVELAAFFRHESAFQTFLETCTNHGNHILSLLLNRGLYLRFSHGVGSITFHSPAPSQQRNGQDSGGSVSVDPSKLRGVYA